jgi:hypothetical protein
VAEILFPLIAGTAFVFLGRWIYKDPRRFQANWLYTNPQHPFLMGTGRVFAILLIFVGSFAIIAALVSQPLSGLLRVLVSLACGIAGAWFLRPRISQSVPTGVVDSPSTATPVKQRFLSKKGKWAAGIAIGVVVLLFVGIFALIANSEVCQLAVEQAQSNSAVAERLGKPIKRGLWVSGNIEVSGPSGRANLEIPLSGPRGKGTLYAVAVRSVGIWKFEALQLAVRGDPNRIDLLSVPLPPRPPNR